MPSAEDVFAPFGLVAVYVSLATLEYADGGEFAAEGATADIGAVVAVSR